MGLGDRTFRSRAFGNRALGSNVSAASDLRGVRALILVGGRPETERFGDIPLALLDVLGRSVLMRTLDRLRAAGVSEITVLSDTEPLPPRPNSVACTFGVAAAECFWGEAFQQFRKLSHQSECVLVLRLGAWAEVDFAAMVNQHRRLGGALTRACSWRGEALDVFVISSSGQAEAAALLRGELRDERIACPVHETDGYVNLLTGPASLRTLTLDAFAGDAGIHPCGRELRPGVWAGNRARIHRGARVVAPAFIGAFSTVRRAAVVSRGSSLEHHSEVDCATVIDNSSVMPYTRVGAGLEVEHSVVGFQQVHSIQRQATVEIEDPHFIGATTTHLSVRMLMVISGLLTFLPNALWKLLSQSSPEPILGSASETRSTSTPALGDPSLAPVESQTNAYRDIAATRRYGNE